MTRENLYDRVTNRIIRELEGGRLPWAQPWRTDARQAPCAAIPTNATTGARYNGINILLLWGAQDDKGYASNKWVTFKQALDLGGNVRKGEKSPTFIVKYIDFVPKKERERAEIEGGDAMSVRALRAYPVFNIEQCDGLPEALYAQPSLLPEFTRHALADDMIAETGADIRHGGAKAFYALQPDYVQLPPRKAFKDEAGYYATAFHELGHWTRHPRRLNRDLGRKQKYSAGYAREELVAELCSAFVCAALGIEPHNRHADYIASWLDLLKNDNRAVFQAASHASKAAEYIAAGADAPRRVAPEDKPKSLATFIVEQGGLRDHGGDVLSILGNSHKARPCLISRNGLEIDAAILRAVEAGYFPDANLDQGILPNAREFIDTLADDLSGRAIYAQGDQRDADDAADWSRYEAERDKWDNLAA